MEKKIHYDGLEMQELKETIGKLSKEVNVLREEVQRLDATIIQMQKNAAESQNTGDASGSGSNRGAKKDMRKYRKLELPLFMGEDPHGWIFRVERYFLVNAIAEHEKVDAAVVCLEGKALNWYRWIESRAPLRNWPEFKRALLRRFYCSQRWGEYEMLFSAKQELSVLEYVEEFERLSAPLKEASEECLIGAFRNGLKTEIEAELRLTRATTLTEIMEMARWIDERNQLPEVRGTVTGSPVKKGGNLRRLSDSELARRWELGLCLKCEDKYSPNHVCKNKHLQVILLEMDDPEKSIIFECEEEGPRS